MSEKANTIANTSSSSKRKEPESPGGYNTRSKRKRVENSNNSQTTATINIPTPLVPESTLSTSSTSSASSTSITSSSVNQGFTPMNLTHKIFLETYKMNGLHGALLFLSTGTANHLQFDRLKDDCLKMDVSFVSCINVLTHYCSLVLGVNNVFTSTFISLVNLNPVWGLNTEIKLENISDYQVLIKRHSKTIFNQLRKGKTFAETYDLNAPTTSNYLQVLYYDQTKPCSISYDDLRCVINKMGKADPSTSEETHTSVDSFQHEIENLLRFVTLARLNTKQWPHKDYLNFYKFLINESEHIFSWYILNDLHEFGSMDFKLIYQLIFKIRDMFQCELTMARSWGAMDQQPIETHIRFIITEFLRKLQYVWSLVASLEKDKNIDSFREFWPLKI